MARCAITLGLSASQGCDDETDWIRADLRAVRPEVGQPAAVDMPVDGGRPVRALVSLLGQRRHSTNLSATRFWTKLNLMLDSDQVLTKPAAAPNDGSSEVIKPHNTNADSS
jgi:hypothetical protein